MPKVSELPTASPATANAMRLVSGGAFNFSQFGSAEATNNQDAFAAAIAAIPEGGCLVVDGLYPVTGTLLLNKRVSVKAASPGHGFIASDSASRQYHLLTVAASGLTVEGLRLSGVAGSLTLGEPCGIHIYDPTDPDGGGAQSFTDIKIRDVEIDDCVCGIRVGYQADNLIGEIKGASRVSITGCRVSDVERFGIECFYSDGVLIHGNDIEMRPAESSAFTIRGIRWVGSSEGIIANNSITGSSDTDLAAIGIDLGNALGYSIDEYMRSPGRLSITGNRFRKCYNPVRVGGCEAECFVAGNVFEGLSTAADTRCIQVTATETVAGYPVKVSRLIVQDNHATGFAMFCRIRGRVGWLRVSNNSFIGGELSGSRLVVLDQPTAEDVRVYFCEILNNTSLTNELTGGGTIRILNAKAGEVYKIEGNNASPDSAGTVLATSGESIGITYSDKNTTLPTGLWATQASL